MSRLPSRPVSLLIKPNVNQRATYQRAGLRKPDRALVSAIEKSALASYTTEDKGLDLVVLRDGEHRQLHHTMAGGLSRRTMTLEVDSVPGTQRVRLCRFAAQFCGDKHTFSTHT
jgi:hypothetical protein